MVNTIEAIFDGKVFHPQQQISLKANTRVRIIIDNISSSEKEYTLDELLAGEIETTEEVDWGKPQGEEIW